MMGKELWRYATTPPGDWSVMTSGMIMMLWLLAGASVLSTLTWVSNRSVGLHIQTHYMEESEKTSFHLHGLYCNSVYSV